MINPYEVFHINPSLPVGNLAGQLLYQMGHLKFCGQVSETKYNKDWLLSLQGKEKEVQKQIILDRLIQARYDYLVQNLPEEDFSVLKQAYEMIGTPEKRKQYEEAKKNSPIISQTQNHDERIQWFMKRQQDWKGNVTKLVPSKEGLEQIKAKNKSQNDPENRYPNYTGYPYEYGVVIQVNRGKDVILTVERNSEQEYILMTKLGQFCYHHVLTPGDKSGERGAEYIVGITKITKNGQIRRNDIMLTSCEWDEKVEKTDFFKNVFLSDEYLDHAKENNHSFLGTIAKARNETGVLENYVEYNEILDTQMVTALALAEYVPGVLLNGTQKERGVCFSEIKEKLANIQKQGIQTTVLTKLKASNKQGEPR